MKRPTSTVGRVLAAVSAGAAGRVVLLARQLALVPLFLLHWNMAEYGEWLLLTSAATQLAALDLGVQTFVVNRLTQHYALDETEAFAALYHTAERAYLAAIPVLVTASVVLTSVVDVGALLGVEHLAATDARIVLCLQVLTVAMGLCFGLVSGVHRATGNLANTKWLSTAHSATVVVAQGIALSIGTSATILAAITTVPSALFLIATMFMGRRRFGKLLYHPQGIDLRLLREVWRGGVWYGGLALSNALRVQATLIAVGHIEGAAGAALYSMIRTLAFTARQIVSIGTAATQTEVTLMDARRQTDSLRTILWALMFGALWITSAGTAGLYVYGEGLVDFWSGGNAPYDAALMAGWIGNLVLGAAWYAAAIIPATTNRPKVLLWANGAGSVVGFGLGTLMTHWLGPVGMVVGLTLAELVISAAPILSTAAKVARAPVGQVLLRVALCTLACLCIGPAVAWACEPLALPWWVGLPFVAFLVAALTAPPMALCLPSGVRRILTRRAFGRMRR